jgi:tetratricopeptide (TPR) repeat protein
MVHEIGKARALAAEWLAAHPVVPYDIQILAGTVLFLAAAASPNRDEAQILLDEAYTRLRSTLRAAEEAGISDDTIFSGWVALGRCLAVMGLIAEALNAFETVAPEYPEAWLEYERLSHWMSQKRSLSDIQESFREDSIATRLLPPSFHQEALLGTKLLAA